MILCYKKFGWEVVESVKKPIYQNAPILLFKADTDVVLVKTKKHDPDLKQQHGSSMSRSS